MYRLGRSGIRGASVGRPCSPCETIAPEAGAEASRSSRLRVRFRAPRVRGGRAVRAPAWCAAAYGAFGEFWSSGASQPPSLPAAEATAGFRVGAGVGCPPLSRLSPKGGARGIPWERGRPARGNAAGRMPALPGGPPGGRPQPTFDSWEHGTFTSFTVPHPGLPCVRCVRWLKV